MTEEEPQAELVQELLSYGMNHPKRGLCLVFDNEEFHWTTKMNRRRGSHVDAANLKVLFEGLGFSVEVHLSGFFSHRDTVNGSWYVQDLCAALKQHGTNMEIHEILALVNRMVSCREVERTMDQRSLGMKQMPCFLSMLTKRLIFTPKN